VKRTVALSAGVLALAAVVYVGGRLSAQGTGAAGGAPAAAPEPRTRIALVNMAYVFKYSAKWKSFQSELKATYDGYEKQAKLKQAEIDAAVAKVKDSKEPPTQAVKDQVELDVTRLKRDLEDLNKKAKAQLGQMSDDQMGIIFKEVYEAAARYAQAHNYDAVFMYTEAVDGKDFFNPNNIIAKLQNRACMPLYYAPGMDVSQQIVMTLNASVRPATPPAGH
jgi:Skp family chaperone for outer membrane proteins